MKNYLMILTLILPFFQNTLANKILPHGGNANPIEEEKTIREQLQERDWIVTQGQFEDAGLTFEAKNTDLHTYGMYRVFTFEDNDQLSFQYFNPSNLMVCGVGLMNITTGTWILNENNELTLAMKGERLGESSFEFKIKYQIEQLDHKNLVLKEVERIISEVQSFYQYQG